MPSLPFFKPGFVSLYFALLAISCSEPTTKSVKPVLRQSQPSALVSISDARESRSSEEARSFRVATFNINFGNVDLAKIVQAITSVDADFVFLQETNVVSEAYLALNLIATYPHSKYANPKRRHWPAGGFGFLSKTPFSEPTYLPPKAGPFGIYLTEISVHGKNVNLINLHLNPIRVGKARGIADLYQAVADMEEVHKKESEFLRSLIDPTRPTIVAGDLNSISSQTVPVALIEQGMSDTIAKTIENADQTPSWHWPVAGRDLALRIDYIFHSPHFTALHGEILPCSASDHEIVIADLKWKLDIDEQ